MAFTLVPPPPPVVAGVAGLVAQLILHSIEEVPAVPFLEATLISETVLGVYLFKISPSVPSLLLNFTLLNAIFWSVLISITLFRRLFLSPLRHFPGYKLAAASKLYEAHLNWNGRLGPVLKDLHRKHGPVIRTGPNEVSINDIDVLRSDIMGKTPWVNRGPFYAVGAMQGNVTVFSTRDNAEHRRLRGIWNKAFAGDPLKDYEVRVEKHASRFLDVLAENSKLNITRAINNVSFDIMSDLGFGIDAFEKGATRQGESSYMAFLRPHMRIAITLSSLPFPWSLLPLLPQDSQTKHFKANEDRMLQERLSLGTTRKDIFTHLLGDHDSGRFSHSELLANAHLICIAGTDTVSSVTTNTYRELCRHPEVQETLAAELRAVVREHGKITCDNIRSLPYLNAVVNEGLRLHAPLPSGSQAITGPEGAVIAGHYIPPRTVVRAPHMPMHTNERYFVDAEKFWPERWLNGGEGVKDRRAFVPFSWGAHACVGKGLALSEVRLCVARGIERYRISFAEEYNDAKWKSQWKDYQTMSVGSVMVRVEKRE